MVFIILRIILVLLIVRALWRLVAGVLDGAGYRRMDRATSPGVKLVRDPVCGIFVAPSRALVARARGETAYFCSEKCRRQWEAR
jgi:YHS domain-containing protein